MDKLKKIIDDLSFRWHLANQQNNVTLRDEIGEELYRYLALLEKQSGKWYQPSHPVDNL